MQISRSLQLSIAGVSLVGIAGLLIYYMLSNATILEDFSLITAREAVLNFLTSIPVSAYWVAFAILPAFGVPLTFFYLTAIPILGQNNVYMALFAAYLALACNITFTRFVTVTILRPIIEKMITKRGLKIPQLHSASEWQIVLTIRLSPLPFPLQNYLLSLSRSKWRYYLGLSLIIQASIGSAIMLLGDSVLKGSFGFALIGLFMFFLIVVVLKQISERIQKKLPEENVKAC